jgi:hypothetical protein
MLEKVFQKLMREAGLEPGHVAQAYQFVVGLKGELEAFKAGVPKVIGHYNARLDTIERKLDHIITALAAVALDPARPGLPPGVIVTPELTPAVTPKRVNGEATPS